MPYNERYTDLIKFFWPRRFIRQLVSSGSEKCPVVFFRIGSGSTIGSISQSVDAVALGSSFNFTKLKYFKRTLSLSYSACFSGVYHFSSGRSLPFPAKPVSLRKATSYISLGGSRSRGHRTSCQIKLRDENLFISMLINK